MNMRICGRYESNNLNCFLPSQRQRVFPDGGGSEVTMEAALQSSANHNVGPLTASGDASPGSPRSI